MSNLESPPSTSSMASRVISAVSRMAGSIAQVATRFSYKYNENAVGYNQPRVTYEFSTNRGEMDPSSPSSPSMRGR